MTKEIGIFRSGGQVMSSREIAELTGKAHKNVIRDIENLASDLKGSDLSFLVKTDTYTTVGNERIKYKQYLLPRRECEILVTGYDAVRRAKVIDRWFELESEKASKTPLIPQTFADALQLAANLEREKQAALLQLEEAKRTKAHINDRRTATLMGKAGLDARKIKKLEMQLQDQGKYLSVIAAGLPERVDTKDRANVQSWRLLKKISNELGLPPEKVNDSRYGKVNTYHVDAINAFKSHYLDSIGTLKH